MSRRAKTKTRLGFMFTQLFLIFIIYAAFQNKAHAKFDMCLYCTGFQIHIYDKFLASTPSLHCRLVMTHPRMRYNNFQKVLM